jgi:hypothetical protein
MYAVSVAVEGIGNTGIWDKLSGGLADSEELVYKPGNMGERESLGGFQTVENVTISRNFKRDRDLNLRPALMTARGKREVTVTKQTLDQDKRPIGRPLVYKGTLKSYSDPEVDSQSTDAGMVEIEITSATVSA